MLDTQHHNNMLSRQRLHFLRRSGAAALHLGPAGGVSSRLAPRPAPRCFHGSRPLPPPPPSCFQLPRWSPRPFSPGSCYWSPFETYTSAPAAHLWNSRQSGRGERGERRREEHFRNGGRWCVSVASSLVPTMSLMLRPTQPSLVPPHCLMVQKVQLSCVLLHSNNSCVSSTKLPKTSLLFLSQLPIKLV